MDGISRPILEEFKNSDSWHWPCSTVHDPSGLHPPSCFMESVTTASSSSTLGLEYLFMEEDLTSPNIPATGEASQDRSIELHGESLSQDLDSSLDPDLDANLDHQLILALDHFLALSKYFYLGSRPPTKEHWIAWGVKSPSIQQLFTKLAKATTLQ